MGNADDQGHQWLAGPMREIGTEMNEQTMEKLVMAAWKETEMEHKNYVTARITRRNEKLNKAHSTNGKYLRQWIRQDYQTPIATMKSTDGSITMNFQQTLVEASRPIFARRDGGEEPRYSDFEERFGRLIPNEPMGAKRITGVELRDTVQRWSNTAAAGADSWKRDVNGNNSRMRCATRLQPTTEEGITTAAIDSEKYFNSICWEVTFQMLDRMGLDQRIWKPISLHTSRDSTLLRERWWTCTKGIVQGCSLSLMATAAPSTVWARVPEEEVPTVICNSIVDDRRLCATGKEAPEQLRSAIQIKRDVDGATGTRFNPLKSTCATPPDRWRKKCNKPRNSLE